MTEILDIPKEAYPTIKEARRFLGVGRWAMKKYTEGAPKDDRIHPAQVLNLAVKAHEDRSLRRSYNEIALHVVRFAQENCPTAEPQVRESVEEFFANRPRPLVLEPQGQKAVQLLGHFNTWY